eukprot:765892-Hanusia_phi.AAC.2
MNAKLNPNKVAHNPISKKARKKELEVKSREQKQIRAQAEKSLDAANWTEQILNKDEKFAGRVEESLEDKLVKSAVGLVTYDELCEKREMLAQEMASRREAEAAEAKKAKKQKVRSTLSFDADDDEDGHSGEN